MRSDISLQGQPATLANSFAFSSYNHSPSVYSRYRCVFTVFCKMSTVPVLCVGGRVVGKTKKYENQTGLILSKETSGRGYNWKVQWADFTVVTLAARNLRPLADDEEGPGHPGSQGGWEGSDSDDDRRMDNDDGEDPKEFVDAPYSPNYPLDEEEEAEDLSG